MSKLDACKYISVGDVLAGKYRVDKILGMGGMGVVVAATHLDLREPRAIKLIRPDAESEQSVERFLREARAVVRLRSEHVAEVYDVGRLESGAPYIVMELLDGQDLSAMLKARGPLPIEEAILYVTQACHALAEAHAAGIVHRDLKPGNLFVTRRSDGSACVKVLDFGISKDTRPTRYDPEMTGAKDLIGSPLYMSPEQMRSARKVDPRADVWALGAILYKLLTGKAPFHAPTVPEIFALTLGKQVRRPSELRPDISSDLDAIILRCLDKQLENRYLTAAELGSALTVHGPWSPAMADSANQMFQSTIRRMSIPPEPPPVSVELVLPDRAADPVSDHSAEASPNSVEPQLGLARSNKMGHYGPVSLWSPSRSSSRPAGLALVVALSILSAFVGATIVAVFAYSSHMPLLSRPTDVSNVREIPRPSRIDEFLPPPVAVANSVVVPPVASIVASACPSFLPAAKSQEKAPSPKIARVASSMETATKAANSATKQVYVYGPAKPETKSHLPAQPFPHQD